MSKPSINDFAAFTVSIPKTITPGWGVWVDVIWDGDDEEMVSVSDCEVIVMEISKQTVFVDNGIVWVELNRGECDSLRFPVDRFARVDDLHQDDTHDLRCRWFETEQQAIDHAQSVQQTWANPNPWTSFVAL